MTVPQPLRHRSGMRCDEYIFQRPERRLRRQWLFCKNIQRSAANSAVPQCLKQSSFVDQLAAAYIDQVSSGMHLRQPRFVDQAGRSRPKWNAQDHKVSLRQYILQLRETDNFVGAIGSLLRILADS